MERRLLVAALWAALLSPAFAQAQPWPVKPVHLVVPFPAGGPTDQLSRKLAQLLASSLGKPVIVENVPGGAGTVGLARVVRSPADGYTIALGASSTLTSAPHMAKVPYDSLTDLQPLGGMVTFAFVLVVPPSEPANNVSELLARSGTATGGVSFGSSGVGTGAHLVTELLRLQAGGNLNHVPYSGAAPALRDVMAGHVGFMFDIVGSSAPLVKAGKLKALAVTGRQRSASLPDVPALAETVPGFEGVGWLAFFAPKGLPAELTQRLHAEIARAYRSPEFTAFFEQTGYEPVAASPEQLKATLEKDYALWGRVIKAAGIKAQ